MFLNGINNGVKTLKSILLVAQGRLQPIDKPRPNSQFTHFDSVTVFSSNVVYVTNLSHNYFKKCRLIENFS